MKVSCLKCKQVVRKVKAKPVTQFQNNHGTLKNVGYLCDGCAAEVQAEHEAKRKAEAEKRATDLKKGSSALATLALASALIP